MDAREINYKWFKEFNEKGMTFIVEINDEEIEIPAEYEVCDLCNGKGKVVNSSIDRHGLSREDFDDDPDFAEDYFSGAYDVPCPECHGHRVTPVPAYDRMETELKALVEQHIADYFSYQREMWNERERGY